MPRISRLNLPPVDMGKESLGRRIARLRRERGYTQNELAERIGLTQALVSDYEHDRLRLTVEMAIRFARALEVGIQELLQPNDSKPVNSRKPSRRVLRRLERIEGLPAHQQATLLKTIDTFLKGAAAG